MTNTFKVAALLSTALLATGCQQNLRPELTAPGQGIQNAPMIATPVVVPNPPTPAVGSLWVPGSRQFFKDSRAHSVGDIVTVVVSEQASAKTEAKTEATREDTIKSGILGLPFVKGQLVTRGIPLGEANLTDTKSNRDFEGEGKTDRKDSLNASIAAVVTQVMPNGLLVIRGEREVLVNYEKQMLQISGVIRPEDISSQNTIPSTKIAEARIAYAGKGNIDGAQTQQYGSRLLDKILPF